jgi:hypothetical protein
LPQDCHQAAEDSVLRGAIRALCAHVAGQQEEPRSVIAVPTAPTDATKRVPPIGCGRSHFQDIASAKPCVSVTSNQSPKPLSDNDLRQAAKTSGAQSGAGGAETDLSWLGRMLLQLSPEERRRLLKIIEQGGETP